VQNVVDRDRLDLVVHPLRRSHRGKAVGEMPNHLERCRPRADDDAGLQHDRLDARVEQDLANRDPRPQMRRKLRIARVQPAQIHESAHPRATGGRDDIACRPGLFGDEVG
jgi:hypothetical protein